MKIIRVVMAAVVAASIEGSAGQAQSSSRGAVPAEFPPASYQGRQYVDSQGCVFIRAGVDGNVTWVPRVSRSRKLICGFQPSITQKAPLADPEPSIVGVAAEPEAPAAKPMPKAVVRKKASVSKAASARKKPTQNIAVATAPAAVRNGSVPACQGLTPVSERYTSPAARNVRCGPQTAPHITYRSETAPQGTVAETAPVPRTRVVPRKAVAQTYTGRVAPAHVYAKQQSSLDGIQVPKGYKPAWTDDRLNSKRTHQTLQGKAQMDLVWSKTVPRYLIDRATGQKVDENFVAVSANYVTISTRSAAPKRVRKPASHRFVQAGLFTSKTKAEAAARRVASQGVAVRLRQVKHQGQRYTAVLAGPFRTQAQLDRGVGAVQAAGYRRVALRK